MNVIKKPWGQEELIEVNNNYVVKRLTMNKGHQCSLQYHEEKHETIYVVEGDLHVRIGDDWKVFSPGEFVALPPKILHRMKAVDMDAIYLESSTPELDDVIRLEDDYRKID
jgi:mannose-6-phosphate isomerase